MTGPSRILKAASIGNSPNCATCVLLAGVTAAADVVLGQFKSGDLITFLAPLGFAIVRKCIAARDALRSTAAVGAEACMLPGTQSKFLNLIDASTHRCSTRKRSYD
jgi:hypothetical protein